MTVFYSNEQVAEFVNDGVEVPKSGKYKVHLLAKAGAHIRLELAGKVFEEIHAGEVATKPSWEEVGEVELEANEIFDVSITPPDLVGEVSMAFETVSEHKIYHGFVNLLRRLSPFSSSSPLFGL